jgi:hypothetical protein
MKRTIVSGMSTHFWLIVVCSIKSVKLPKNYKKWINKFYGTINMVE